MKSEPARTSTETQRIEGNLLTPEGWRRGRITFGDRILGLEAEPVPWPDPGLPLVLPGFVDLHVHGGGGADIMGGPGAAVTTAQLHARHGTTSLLATTVSAERPDLVRAFTDVAQAMASRAPGSARILGVHLEGPFINPAKLGAQPDCARTGTLEEVLDLHRRAPIRVLTLAPELAGHLDLIRALRAEGIRAQVGHSTGDYEDGRAALEAGASGFTHLFNAMTPLHHRAPGMVGCALAHARFAELIPDLLHVHPGAILAALRAIPRLYCVTDATAGAGMPDGAYALGTQQVTKCGNGIRLGDGTLAGSTLTMDDALRNLVAIGVPLEDASRRVSAYPAEYAGLEGRGRLEPGAWADLALLGPALELLQVFVEGEAIDLADA
jgi:N-acetylglucosamine-6-phosphate deacetylase